MSKKLAVVVLGMSLVVVSVGLRKLSAQVTGVQSAQVVSVGAPVPEPPDAR